MVPSMLLLPLINLPMLGLNIVVPIVRNEDSLSMAFPLGRSLRLSIHKRLLRVLSHEKQAVALLLMLFIALLIPDPLGKLPSMRNSLIAVLVITKNQLTMSMVLSWHLNGMTRSRRMTFDRTRMTLNYESPLRKLHEQLSRSPVVGDFQELLIKKAIRHRKVLLGLERIIPIGSTRHFSQGKSRMIGLPTPNPLLAMGKVRPHHTSERTIQVLRVQGNHMLW